VVSCHAVEMFMSGISRRRPRTQYTRTYTVVSVYFATSLHHRDNVRSDKMSVCVLIKWKMFPLVPSPSSYRTSYFSPPFSIFSFCSAYRFSSVLIPLLFAPHPPFALFFSVSARTRSSDGLRPTSFTNLSHHTLPASGL